MSEISEFLRQLTSDEQVQFQKQRAILSLGSFLDLVKAEPKRFMRSAAAYLVDTFEYFGVERVFENEKVFTSHFKLFDTGSERNGPIVGGEWVQEDIYHVLKGFVRQGVSNRLLLLHGPNGSAKSCTIEAIAHAMARYSVEEEGAVYRFNWIFPSDRSTAPRSSGESGPIGFGGQQGDDYGHLESYAHYDETKISSKIHSEFKDNPLFLIPMPQREELLRKWIAARSGCNESEVELPPAIKLSGLSKKNQLIFENLYNAYDGDIVKVFRHVQVERFYYSAQYRVGVAAVEPRMSMDAGEQQLTMDKNIANLPSVLANIRFHEAMGPIVEANRGILEFSDMLKRPVEAFKYLLTTVEKGTLDLPSSTANLDIVFFGTTNEKHLDAFKTVPDFSSFRSRFHLITVPYLLRPSLESRIYRRDIDSIRKATPIAPHCLELLCLWAVMTRLKQPDPEQYPAAVRGIISRLDPRNKVRIYEGESLGVGFKPEEEAILREYRFKLMWESRDTLVYEGRFGASPREIKSILYRASQNEQAESLTPVSIFEELDRLVKDRTVYEFLQFEARGKYHDAAAFIDVIRDEFAAIYERELTLSMTLVAEDQYDSLLNRYVEHAVAFVKKEKIYQDSTSSYQPANESLMREVESIIGVNGAADKHRDNMMARIAARKLSRPDQPINVLDVFADYLAKIQEHYHKGRQALVEDNFRTMLKIANEENVNGLKPELRQKAESTFEELERRFGYDRASAITCLRFMMSRRKSKS